LSFIQFKRPFNVKFGVRNSLKKGENPSGRLRNHFKKTERRIGKVDDSFKATIGDSKIETDF